MENIILWKNNFLSIKNFLFNTPFRYVFLCQNLDFYIKLYYISCTIKKRFLT